MVFNENFNNISVISWQSVLLTEETRVPGENQICRKSLTYIHEYGEKEKENTHFILKIIIERGKS
jgi:hypothetical protein